MNEKKIKVSVKFEGLEEYKEQLNVVENKIKELEEAVQELNEVDISISLNH